MNFNNKEKKIDFVVSLILTGVVIALHFFVFHKLDFADDAVITSHAKSLQDVFQYLHLVYFTWSGRLILAATELALGEQVFLWRLLNISLILTMGCAIGRMALGRRKIYTCASVGIASIFLIPEIMLGESVAWFTGSFNYLWPVAFGVLGLLHFVHPGVRLWRKRSILLMACSLYAANAEQAALFMLILATLWSIYLKRERQANVWHFLHLFVIYAGAIFLFVAPGNHNRLVVEAGAWFPDYLNLDYFQRFSLGLSRLLEHAFNANNLLLQLLAVLLIIQIFQEKLPKYIKAIFIAGCGFIVLPLLLKITGNIVFVGWLFREDGISMTNFMQWNVYMRVGILMFSLIASLVAVCVIFIKPRDFTSYQVPLIYVGGFFATIVIGFSSTVYISGSRVLYVGDMAFAFVLCALLAKFALSHQSRSLYYFMKYAICILAILQMINYFSHINTDWPFR